MDERRKRRYNFSGLTLGQCKINSRWPTWLLLPRCKDGLISLEITIFSLTFRRFSGDVEAAGGRLTSYLFSPFRSWRKTFNSPHSRLAIFPFVFSRSGSEGRRETERAAFGNLRCDEDKKKLSFPLENKRRDWQDHGDWRVRDDRRVRDDCPIISLDRRTMRKERRSPYNLTIGYF